MTDGSKQPMSNRVKVPIIFNSAHKEKSFHMRKVSTSFICLSLSTLEAVDRKQEIWRVGGGGGGEKIFLLYFIIFSK